MENNREIEEIMMGMVYEKAVEVYSEALVEHGTNPRNYGIIDHPDGYAKITGVCGDTVEMYLQMKDKKIEETKFVTDGCMFSVAACSAAAEIAKGKTVQECIGVNQSAILDRLQKMPKDHEHCALLAAMTFQKALRQCVKGHGSIADKL